MDLAGRAKSTVSLRRKGKGMLAEMSVNAVPERVWRILTSFEEMPAYLTSVQSSRTLRHEGVHRLIEQTGTVGASLMSLPFKVLLDVVERRPYLHFTQRFGSLAPLCGYWRVDPSSEGRRSLLRYYLEVDVGRVVGRRAVETSLNRMILQNLQELAVWMENPESPEMEE